MVNFDRNSVLKCITCLSRCQLCRRGGVEGGWDEGWRVEGRWVEGGTWMGGGMEGCRDAGMKAGGVETVQCGGWRGEGVDGVEGWRGGGCEAIFHLSSTVHPHTLQKQPVQYQMYKPRFTLFRSGDSPPSPLALMGQNYKKIIRMDWKHHEYIMKNERKE